MSKVWVFTLVLDNVHFTDGKVIDDLYEAGCGDAVICGYKGKISITFDREAETLKEAIVTAVRQVQSTNVKVSKVNISVDDILCYM